MDKIISRDYLNKKPHIQNLDIETDESRIEKLVEIIKAADEGSVNQHKVEELKLKLKNNDYIVDYDAVGEEIFKEFTLEL